MLEDSIESNNRLVTFIPTHGFRTRREIAIIRLKELAEKAGIPSGGPVSVRPQVRGSAGDQPGRRLASVQGA